MILAHQHLLETLAVNGLTSSKCTLQLLLSSARADVALQVTLRLLRATEYPWTLTFVFPMRLVQRRSIEQRLRAHGLRRQQTAAQITLDDDLHAVLRQCTAVCRHVSAVVATWDDGVQC